MPAKRPDLIFIVADDLGCANLGCDGGRDSAFEPVSPQPACVSPRGAGIHRCARRRALR